MASSVPQAVQSCHDFCCGSFRSLTNFLARGDLRWASDSRGGLLDVLELLVEAAYTRNKESPLRRANLRLEVVRHLWRLAYELKAVAIRQYEHGAKLMDELGRQIGGWLRSTGQSQPNI